MMPVTPPIQEGPFIMTNNQRIRTSRIALITVAIGLMLPVANAQPVTPMPADIVKPMPKSGMDMKPGMDMKHGMEMKPGMDMKTMMTDMHNKMMGMKSTGNADVDFAMMMREHHLSAVTMGEAQLQNGKNPQMRTMAKNIIRDQKKEIAMFDKFLAKHSGGGMKMDGAAMPMKK